MHVQSTLVTTIVIGIGLAFVLATLAHRLKTSVLAGYLLAGVAVGPFTPGFVADQGLANQLAEIGVILLMFGVGLHFSLADLLAVRAIAIPCTLVQVAVASALGFGLAMAFGWPIGAGVVFGLALSIASTVVVLRTLQDRRLMDTRRGHIAIGWLVIQDLLTVLALVLLPPLSGLLHGNQTPEFSVIGQALAITLGKVAAFIALMLLIGRRVVPLMLHYVAHTGSRELFRLAVLSLALGVAFIATEVFDVSFALGAFVAGMVLSESQLSQRAAEETLPLRDAFAVLFFVSVGMLFDPTVLVHHPLPLLGTLAVILIGTPLTAAGLLLLMGESAQTALLLAIGLAQIGEFSFILAGLGLGLGLLPEAGRDLILGASILSIFLNPVLFALLDHATPWLLRRFGPPPAEPMPVVGTPAPAEEAPALPRTALRDHVVLVGYGRVGSLVGERLRAAGAPFLVIEAGEDTIAALRAKGIEVIAGNAADPAVLQAANLTAARLLLLAIPEAFEAGQITEQARLANPALRIIARAHFDAAVEHLGRHGADVVIMGEREIARAMLSYAEGREPAEETNAALAVPAASA